MSTRIDDLLAELTLDAGERTVVRLALDERAFAYWDSGDRTWASTAAARAAGPVPAGLGARHREVAGWFVDAGEYRLHVGRSSADLAHVLSVSIDD